MYFNIKNGSLMIFSQILGGSNNLKIIGFPNPNNQLTFINDDILKIKDVYWQLNIDNTWTNDHKGNDYIVAKENIGNQLRIFISYYDKDNFLDNIIIPYFSISLNNTYMLPYAKLNKEYFFKFMIEDDEQINLESDWLNYENKNKMIILHGVPKDISELNFHLEKDGIITKNFKILMENSKIDKEKILIMKKDNENMIVDNLYFFIIETNKNLKSIIFEIEKLPKWLNFVNNNDGTAIISGVPKLGNVGKNIISLVIFSENSREKLEYIIKVFPDRELPVLKELKKMPKVTKSNNVYYNFSCSKSGNLIFNGNIYSESKTAKIGINKILLNTDSDGIYSGSIKVKDFNRNISLPLQISPFKVDRAKPILVNVHIESNGKNPNYAKLNDIIKLKLTSDKEINVTSLIMIDQLIEVTQIDKINYEGIYKLDKEIISKKVNFNINFEDYLKTKGDEVFSVTDNSFVIIDMVKPKLISVKVSSSNENKFLGIIDDIISIEIISDKIINNLNIEFFGEFVNIIKIDDFNFIGKYSILEDINENNLMLKIEYEDLAGNKGDIITDTTDNSYIEIL